jgi:hypothetical protein
MELTIKDDVTIYDLALQTGYTLDYIYTLIQENSILLNVDTTPPKLNTITYDNSFVPKNVPQLTLKQNANQSDVGTLQKRDGQSIYDLCLQSYGSLDLVYKLIQDNNLTNIDDTVETGKELSFYISKISDISVYKQFKKYSTSITSIPIIPPIPLGYLIKLGGGYILQQNGKKIILT